MSESLVWENHNDKNKINISYKNKLYRKLFLKSSSDWNFYNNRFARPRKTRKEKVSVIAIRKTPEEIAGSNFKRWSNKGITAPEKPPIITVPRIADAKTELK